MKKLFILLISVMTLSIFSCSSPDPSEGELSQGHYLNRLDAEKEAAEKSARNGANTDNIQNEAEESPNGTNVENTEITSGGTADNMGEEANAEAANGM